ncbi:nucleotidyltransferase family protein [Bradyrhizobium sp. SZCCHNRI20481]|uniref:nucleotidyltransferase family protein n=1 Tax=Bradyrhizobium sp. SZCCHNRI20481 TaxID=3057286 RepID=UPI002916CA72|nr:nucleotidyltransferase family protein [Bradyrhizobium sp. SZCCHNRI20481]
MSAEADIEHIEALFPIAMWAFGSRPLRTILEFPDRDVEAACGMHKVVGVALKRLRESRQEERTRRLIARLSEVALEIEREHERMKRVLEWVASVLAESGVEMIYLKGGTRYLTSGRIDDLRSAADLDVIVSDADKCLNVLQAQGFESYRIVSDHELVNLTVQGVHVDFHKYFPILEFDHDIDKQHPHAANGEGRSYKNFSIRPLEFQTIRKHVDRFPGLPSNTFFTKPIMSSLITAAHSYRDYVMRSSVSMRRKPVVRIGDLVEFNYYTSHPAFELATFHNLVEASCVSQSVGWIREVTSLLSEQSLRTEVGSSPLSSLMTRYPRSIFGPFCASYLMNVEEICASQLTTEKLLRAWLGRDPGEVHLLHDRKVQFGRQEISSSAELIGERESMSCLPADLEGATLHHESPTAKIVIGLGFGRRWHETRSRIHLELASELIEVNHRPQETNSKVKGTRAAMKATLFEVDQADDHCRVRFVIDLSGLDLVEKERIAAIISIAEIGQDQRMSYVMVLPLTLVLREANASGARFNDMTI